MIDPKDLENQLREVLKECASLRKENELAHLGSGLAF
jgi:hypothetical protein